MKQGSPELETVTPSAPSQNQPDLALTDEDLAWFIGANLHKYLRKFKKFNMNGVDRFSLTWHWPAFFFGALWMLYRKLYLWAVGAFILSFIPYLNFLAVFVYGATANYLYYKHTKKKVAQLKLKSSSQVNPHLLYSIGGTSLLAVAMPFLILFVVGILSALAIPQFSAYQERSLRASLAADLRNAATAQEAFFVDNLRYSPSVQKLLDEYGLILSEGVEIVIVSATEEEYKMIAFSDESDKQYYIHGPGGEVVGVERSAKDIMGFNNLQINAGRKARQYRQRKPLMTNSAGYDQSIMQAVDV
jgi:type II secretory pathway pseudopilin PulG